MCLVILNGCGGNEAPTDEASPTAQTESSDMAPNDKKPKDKNAPQKTAKKAPEPQVQDPTQMATLEQAEAAFAAGRYRDAAIIAENSLTVLKSDGASRAEVVKRMEYLAQCQIEAKTLDKACLTYAELAKAQPSNEIYIKAWRTTRQAYWDQALNPQLEEAKRLRDRKRFTAAQALVDEVRNAAVKVQIDPGPADKVTASITTAQAAQPSKASPDKVAIASPPPAKRTAQKAKPKKPKKAVAKKAPVKSESEYPTSQKR